MSAREQPDLPADARLSKQRVVIEAVRLADRERDQVAGGGRLLHAPGYGLNAA